MLNSKDYLHHIQEALNDALSEDGSEGDAESLVAHLAARGLSIVELPPGLKCDFVGVVQQ